MLVPGAAGVVLACVMVLVNHALLWSAWVVGCSACGWALCLVIGALWLLWAHKERPSLMLHSEGRLFLFVVLVVRDVRPSQFRSKLCERVVYSVAFTSS